MKRLLLTILLVTFLWPAAAVPAEQAVKGIAASKAADPALAPATLKIHNRPIVTLRGTLLGYTPKQRIEAAEARINAVIERGAWETVTTKTISEGLLIQIGEQGMFVITPGDLNTLAGETPEQAGTRTARNLTTALGEIGEASRAETFLRGIGYTAAATLILFLVLAGIRRSHRWLSTHLAEVLGPRLKTLAIGGFTQHIQGIILFLGGLVGLTAWALSLFSLYLWLDFSFMQFPYTRPWGEQLHDYMTSGIKAIALTIVNFIPGLVIVAVIFIITRFLARIGRLFFDAVESGRVSVPGLYAETAQPTRRIVTVILWLFSLVMMYPYLPGSDERRLQGGERLRGPAALPRFGGHGEPGRQRAHAHVRAGPEGGRLRPDRGDGRHGRHDGDVLHADPHPERRDRQPPERSSSSGRRQRTSRARMRRAASSWQRR